VTIEGSSHDEGESEKKCWRRKGMVLLVPTAIFGATGLLAGAINEETAARICTALAFICVVLAATFLLGQRWKPGDPLPPDDLFDP
jgi:hypothetical protein